MTTEFKNFETAVDSMFGDVEIMHVRKGYADIVEGVRAVKVSKFETSAVREQILEDGVYSFVYKRTNKKLHERMLSKQFLEVFTGGVFANTVMEKVTRRVKLRPNVYTQKVFEVEIPLTLSRAMYPPDWCL